MKKIFVLCGPGGVGKSKVAGEVSRLTGLEFVKAYTTRTRRPNENDYHFVTKEEFLNFVKSGEMAEYSHFCGAYYGRKVADFDKTLKNNDACIVILDPISIKSARELPYFSGKKIVFIFIDARDEILRERLQKRGEKREVMSSKLSNANLERESKAFCDFVVYNNDFEDCVGQVCQIILENR